jgi:uncharacterized protein YeeX (DUF496 family)
MKEIINKLRDEFRKQHTPVFRAEMPDDRIRGDIQDYAYFLENKISDYIIQTQELAEMDSDNIDVVKVSKIISKLREIYNG